MSQRIDTGYADTGGVEKSLPPCPHDSREGNASQMDFQSEKQDDKLAGFPVKRDFHSDTGCFLIPTWLQQSVSMKGQLYRLVHFFMK